MNHYEPFAFDAETPTRSGPLPLLVAFILGIVSPFFFAPLAVTPQWAQPGAALAVLLIAALFSRAGAREARGVARPFLGLLGIVVVIGGLGGAFIALNLSQPPVGTSAYQQAFFTTTVLPAALVPVIIGAACALVAQRRPGAGRALAGAELGWFAATAANIVAVILGPGSANPEGALTSVIIAAAASVVGFALAAVGGLLGWGICVFGAASGKNRRR